MCNTKGDLQVFNKYNVSSQALRDLIKEIEDTKGEMVDSLKFFLAVVAQASSEPIVGAHSDMTEGPEGLYVYGFDMHHISNEFSNVAFTKELMVGAAGTKPSNDVGVKNATPLSEVLGKSFHLCMPS